MFVSTCRPWSEKKGKENNRFSDDLAEWLEGFKTSDKTALLSDLRDKVGNLPRELLRVC